jgi:hypothetical protein
VQRRPCSEHVDIGDELAARSEHRDDRQGLVATIASALLVPASDSAVDRVTEPEPVGEPQRDHQPGIRNSLVVVKYDAETARKLRHWLHDSSALRLGE